MVGVGDCGNYVQRTMMCVCFAVHRVYGAVRKMDGMISFKQLEKMYSNDASRLKFITALQHFLYSKRDTISPTILSEVPIFVGKPVDLYELFHQVDRREGFERVNSLNKWSEVIEAMRLQTTPGLLRECYVKYLRMFEEAIRKKAQQQPQQNASPRPLENHPPHSTSSLSSSSSVSSTSLAPPVPSPAPSPAPGPVPAPRPQVRPLEAQDLSTMPPQKRPRPEMGQANSGNMHPSNSSYQNQPRPTIPRTQSLTSAAQQQHHNAPLGSPVSMTSSNMTNQNASIIVSATNINGAIKSLYSCDQNSIKQGLNYLMQLSTEGDNVRNILYLEKYPTLITALGNLLDTINPFTKLLFAGSSSELLDPSFNISQHLLSNTDKYSIYWNDQNPLDHDNVLQAIARTLDTNTLLIAALCILRNLSFEMSNVQMIAYSAPIMQHLVALLLVVSSPTATALPVAVPYVFRSRNPAITQASSYSLDTLYHISKHIDITGAARIGGIAEDCWLRDTLAHNASDRDSLKVYLTDHMSAKSTGKYVAATSFLFPALLRCITESYERDITRRCLGILTKLTTLPTNTHIFAHKCSDKILSNLVQLLCTNITSTESIRVYYPPTADSNQYEAHSAATSGLSSVLLDRLPAASGDFNDFSDMEIRDMVLDTLRGLCSHSDISSSSSSLSSSLYRSDISNIPIPIPTESLSLKERIASQHLCLQLLLQILSSSVGRMSKSEGFHRALSLLSLLAMHPKNHQKFLLIQKNLCFIAMADETIAEAVMTTSLRNIVQNTVSYVSEVHVQDD